MIPIQAGLIYNFENGLFSNINWNNNLKLLHPCDSMACWKILKDNIKWLLRKKGEIWRFVSRCSLKLRKYWTGGTSRQETLWLYPSWIIERVWNNNGRNLVSQNTILSRKLVIVINTCFIRTAWLIAIVYWMESSHPVFVMNCLLVRKIIYKIFLFFCRLSSPSEFYFLIMGSS